MQSVPPPDLIQIAPMLGISNQFYRYFMRLLTKKSLIYTEMVVDSTLILSHKNIEQLIPFDPIEHPLCLQLAGCNVENLGKSAVLVEGQGYDYINLNSGCPSRKVVGQKFGAQLMLEPELVGNILKSMRQQVKIPVSIKCRIGVDQKDSYEDLHNFVKTVYEISKCDCFVIHARKAWLKGIDTKKNRTIPELKPEFVYKLQEDFPMIQFTINGEIRTYEQIQFYLDKKLKVMIGRQAYNHPWLFSDVDRRFYNSDNQGYSRREIIQKYSDYVQNFLDSDLPVKSKQNYPNSYLAKPLNHLFTGEKHCTRFKQVLNKMMIDKARQGKFKEICDELVKTMEQLNPDALDMRPPIGNQSQINQPIQIKPEQENQVNETQNENKNTN